MTHYSPSQIASYRDCPRKWWWRSVKDVPPKPNRFAALGTAIHQRLQRYLETGELPSGSETTLRIEGRGWSEDDLMEIMLPGMPYLPGPGAAECERDIELDLGEFGTMRGYVDFLHAHEGVAEVGDHKTTSNLRWAKTAEDLKTDPQAITYSVAALEHFGLDEAHCGWIYYCTGKPQAKLVECRFSLTELQTAWQSLLDEIAQMHPLRHVEDYHDVPKNIESCTKYGGCPYRENCALGANERLKGLLSMASLKEKMMAAKAKPIPTATAVAEKAKPVPEETKTAGLNPPESVGPLARLQAMKAAKAAGPPAPAKEETAHSAPTEGAKAAPAPAKEVEAAPAPAKAVPAAPAATTKPIRMLCIDCSPDGEMISFGELAQPVLAAIKQEHGSHYRLIQGLYGGNGALFAESLAEHLQQNPCSIPVVVSSASPIARDALNVLEQMSLAIVRGLK
jgi:RecB family exonuclease